MSSRGRGRRRCCCTRRPRTRGNGILKIRELGADRTVVAPDLRGYGRSPLTSAPFSHAGDVVRLLDHLGIDRCAVVGSSGGGAVALQVAAAVPDRVSALVLLCAAANGVETTADLRAFAERESALLRDDDVAGATELNVTMWLQPEVDAPTRELFREMQSNAFRVQLAAGDDVHEEDAEVDLASISCLATVVTGVGTWPGSAPSATTWRPSSLVPIALSCHGPATFPTSKARPRRPS